MSPKINLFLNNQYVLFSSLKKRFINTKSHLHSSVVVIVRNENYKIIDRCNSYNEAREKHGKNVSINTFNRALKTGKFIKNANIFVEYELSKKENSNIPDQIKKLVDELQKSPRLTGRFKFINSETQETIGVFSSPSHAYTHFNGKISLNTLYRIKRNLGSDLYKIKVEFEYRDFRMHTLFYK